MTSVVTRYLTTSKRLCYVGQTFGLLFYLKPAKNQNGTIRYVYLRITVDGKVAELSTKKLWNTERWNSSVGLPAGNKEDAKTLNTYLDMLTAKVYQAKKILTEDDKEISAEGLKNILLGKSNETRTILEVFQLIISRWKPWSDKS